MFFQHLPKGVPAATDWAQILLEPLWALVVAILAVGLVWLFRRPLQRLGRDLGLARLSIFGIDVEGIEGQARAAFEMHRIPAPDRRDLRAFGLLSARLAPLVSGRTVLWVDDRPTNNAIEIQLLRKLGVDVVTALDTQEALERFATVRHRFDLVISDWTRSGPNDGPELALALQHRGRPTPVLFYVGDASPARRALAAELGAVGVTGLPDELLKLALVELATA
jgi:CheY-like chemotaxis protein